MGCSVHTVCVDFDAVIAKYDIWRGKGVFGEPVDGAIAGLQRLKNSGWKIIVFTTRSETDQVKEYLVSKGIPFDAINFNEENIDQGCSLCKPLADVYLDDRAVVFEGDWGIAVDRVQSFVPWFRKL